MSDILISPYPACPVISSAPPETAPDRPVLHAAAGMRQGCSGCAISADISRLAEAWLITERDIRSDVVRIRNGCAQAADGAIAVGRAAQNGRFQRRATGLPALGPRNFGRGGPRRAGLDDDLG